MPWPSRSADCSTSNRSSVWIGSRSYGIYLIHVTCRSFILELKETAGIAEGSATAALWSVISVIVILLLAELNYRLVETPARRAGRRVADDLRLRLQGPPLPEARLAVERMR